MNDIHAKMPSLKQVDFEIKIDDQEDDGYEIRRSDIFDHEPEHHSLEQLITTKPDDQLNQFQVNIDLNRAGAQDCDKFWTENSPRQEDNLIPPSKELRIRHETSEENVVFDSDSSKGPQRHKNKLSPKKFKILKQNNQNFNIKQEEGAKANLADSNTQNNFINSSENCDTSQDKSSRNTIDGDLIDSQIISVENSGLYLPSNDESHVEDEHGIKNYNKLGNIVPNRLNRTQNKNKSQKSKSFTGSQSVDLSGSDDIQQDSEILSSVSDLTGLDEQEPQDQLLRFIESFYDNNYFINQIKSIKDWTHKKVWSLHYDQIYDQVYVFVAEIEIISKQRQNPRLPPKMAQSFNDGAPSAPTYPVRQIKRAQTRLQNSHDQISNKNYNLRALSSELDALRSTKDPECIFTLKIQIWNLDDRMMSQKGNTKISPHFEKICLKTNEKVSGSFNKFQIMQILYNKYMDHSQLVQFEDKIFIFKDFYNFRIFDIQERNFVLNPIQVFDHSKQKTFKALFHMKEGLKNSKSVDKLLVFSYNQYRQNRTGLIKGLQSDLQLQQQTSQVVGPWVQTLALRHMDYDTLCSQTVGQTLKVTNIEILIDDEKLYQYYAEQVGTKKLNSMFVQRIDDSQSYIIMFPTGLIYTVGLNPLIVQSKFQLTLKKDESIIDYQYSISEDSKFHCIWILDEKLQVWKCNNECNPNQVVWTLTRAAIFNKVKIPKFFQQATTYDEFYMNDFLVDFECYKKSQKEPVGQQDILVAFNSTATKVMMISQPVVPLMNIALEEFQGSAALEMLTSSFSLTIDQIKNLNISFQIILQQQTIILNKIRKKRDNFVKAQAKQLGFSDGQKAELKDDDKQYLIKQEDNEILELQYLKRVKLKLSGQNDQRFFQQFLVRRKRCLQIMFTNGLSFWAQDIARSHTVNPYVIQDILLSQDNKTLVDYCSIPGYPQRCFYRVYKYEDHLKSFKLVQEQQVKTSAIGLKLQEMSNIALDNDGEVLYIKIQLTNSEKQTNLRQSIKLIREKNELLLQIPKFIIFKELIKTSSGIAKIMTSDDGRIFMCNRLLIQLDKDLSSIMNIGCISLKRSHQKIEYKFLSLLDDEPRKKLSHIMKKASDIQCQIVQFDILNEPLTMLNDEVDVLYFSNEIQDPQQQNAQGTSIVKMSMDNLDCIEIYRSNLNIVHFAMFDPDDMLQSDEDDIDKDEMKKELEEAKRLAQMQQMPAFPGQEDIAVSQGSDKAAIDKSKMLAFLAQQLQDNVQKNAEGGEFELNSLSSKSVQDAVQNNKIQAKRSVVPKISSKSDDEQDANPQIKMKIGDIQNDDEDRMTDDLREVLNLMSGPVPSHAPDRQAQNFDKPGIKRQQMSIKETVLPQSEDENKTIFISLVSQTKTQIKIEVLADKNCKDQFKIQEQESIDILKQMTDSHGLVSHQQKFILDCFKAKLIHCINVNQDKELAADSEIGWINADQFILTIDNEYYICNINGSFMESIKEGITFGKQQVNISQFVSIVSQQFKTRLVKRATTKNKFSSSKFRNFSDQNNQLLLKAQEVIQRMELASLIRFAFIQKAQDQQGINKQLLFFLPCEELKGGSIFQKLSFNYNVIQPYIEKIDNEFIKILNYRIRNIQNYLNKSIENGKLVPIKNKKILNAGEEDKNNAYQQKMQVHMFQEDITGQNAIDNAFDKNSIFCIKAYVDFLLTLANSDDVQFTNCFDKALLLMINKGMDVKELVQSQILYPSLWSNQTIFSHIEDLEIRPYSNTFEELLFEDPYEIFAQDDFEYKAQKKEATANNQIVLRNWTKYQDEDIEQSQKEQHEMQFNYLDLHVIQGQNVLNLATYLADSLDLKLFEIEAIQVIIDYKWNTYARRWFMLQLIIYAIFLFFFYMDMQSMFVTEVRNEIRVKDKVFILNKVVCFFVQFFFMFYEFSQFYQSEPRYSYFLSFSNYLPLASLTLYMSASINDLIMDRPSDIVKILYVLSTLMSLANVLLLVRVFKQLSFLVIMMRMVVSDLLFFMLLFFFFIFTFAACYQIMQVDGSSYGRINNMFAMFVATVRSSFGDFSLIHPWQGFDIFDEDEETGEPIYNNSQTMVTFTYVIFILQSLTLFMVFMNFIIAVIADSYQTVIEFSVAHDYKQRIEMIQEREMYFTKQQLQDPYYFPKFLVIKKKRNTISDRNNIQNQIKGIKDFVREASLQSTALINEKSKEQKEHQNNSFKKLENDLTGIKSDITKVLSEFKQLSSIQQEQSQKQTKIAKALVKIQKSINPNDFQDEFTSHKSDIAKQTEMSKKSINLMTYKSPAVLSDFSFEQLEQRASQSPAPQMDAKSQQIRQDLRKAAPFQSGNYSPQIVKESEKLDPITNDACIQTSLEKSKEAKMNLKDLEKELRLQVNRNIQKIKNNSSLQSHSRKSSNIQNSNEARELVRQKERMDDKVKKLSQRLLQSSNENQKLRQYIEAIKQMPNQDHVDNQFTSQQSNRNLKNRSRNREVVNKKIVQMTKQYNLQNILIPIDKIDQARSKTPQPFQSPKRSLQMSPKQSNMHPFQPTMFDKIIIQNERANKKKLKNKK